MRRWQLEVIFWVLWPGVFVAAGLANRFPRRNTWCLVGAGVSAVSAYAFVAAAAWRGWGR